MKNTTRFWSFAIPSVLALFQAQSAVLDEGVTLEIGEVVINEFMASNDGGQTSNPNDWYPITNQINGTTHDWIEILNNSSSPLDLGGWHLTDDTSALEKWTFPSPTSIPAGGFLIVYASGLDTLDASGNLNTNFKLSSGGEYLALVNSSGTITSEFCPDDTNYPKQDEDVSYGLDPTNGNPVYFSSPSPGFANNTSGIAKVLDTNFSPDRGYYSQAINVTITSDTPGATIYFTTDGTRPVNQTGDPTANASIYAGPIPVNKTMTLK
ncbi:MAG: hypothetical protein HOK04_09390, partial [Verrucomicrobia bacterium]|nr:hypothetical protein [Verrucomicrobiota bacterium]